MVQYQPNLTAPSRRCRTRPGAASSSGSDGRAPRSRSLLSRSGSRSRECGSTSGPRGGGARRHREGRARPALHGSARARSTTSERLDRDLRADRWRRDSTASRRCSSEGKESSNERAQTTDKAEVRKEGDREIHIERVFDAPRELRVQGVHRPGADPASGGAPTTPRPSSTRWTLAPAATGGSSTATPTAPRPPSAATFREVTPPERIAWTFEWDGMPGYVERRHRRVRGPRRADAQSQPLAVLPARGARRHARGRHGVGDAADLRPPRRAAGGANGVAAADGAVAYAAGDAGRRRPRPDFTLPDQDGDEVSLGRPARADRRPLLLSEGRHARLHQAGARRPGPLGRLRRPPALA